MWRRSQFKSKPHCTYSLCLLGNKKRIVEVAFEIKGLIFPFHQEHQPRRSLLFIKLSMLFIILNVAAFSWVVLSNLQSSPSNCSFYWYTLEHIYTISKCYQHTHGHIIQYASPYLSLTWYLPPWFASEGFAYLPHVHQNQPFSSLNCSHHFSLVFWRFCSLEVSSENNLHVSPPVHWEERKIMLLEGAFSPVKTAPSPLPDFHSPEA